MNNNTEELTIIVPEVWRERFEQLRYGVILSKFFSVMIKPDATEEDAIEFAALLEQKLKITIEELDAQIQTGVDNGYSVEDQLLIIHKVLGLPTN